jgi:hypothetical protein
MLFDDVQCLVAAVVRAAPKGGRACSTVRAPGVKPRRWGWPSQPCRSIPTVSLVLPTLNAANSSRTTASAGHTAEQGGGRGDQSGRRCSMSDTSRAIRPGPGGFYAAPLVPCPRPVSEQNTDQQRPSRQCQARCSEGSLLDPARLRPAGGHAPRRCGSNGGRGRPCAHPRPGHLPARPGTASPGRNRAAPSDGTPGERRGESAQPSGILSPAKRRAGDRDRSPAVRAALIPLRGTTAPPRAA